MTQDPRLYLDGILDAIAKIEKYSNGLSINDFADNDLIVDAIVRNFEIIGILALYHPGI